MESTNKTRRIAQPAGSIRFCRRQSRIFARRRQPDFADVAIDNIVT
jgi:hypothetical protein